MLDKLRLLPQKIHLLPSSQKIQSTEESQAAYARSSEKKFEPATAGPITSVRSLSSWVFSRASRISFNFPDSHGAPKTVHQDVNITPSGSLLIKDLRNKEDIRVIKKILPTIVRVSAEDANNKGWYGSGAIMKPSDIIPGYNAMPGEYFVLTNQHVAGNAKYLTVKLANGEEYKATVVKSPDGAELLDDDMDIALMRIYIPYSLPTATVGDPKKLEIGQPIYTVGHPKALPNVAVTKGIISNPSQETGELSLDIQSDAPINGGNSGGPSFNQEGEFIGLNTYTFRDSEDLTFTKPIDEQIDALLNIWENGHIVRGAINISLSALSLIDRIQMGFPENKTGAIIKTVAPLSAASKAGLRAGDIVTWMEVRSNGSAVEVLDVDIHDRFEAEGIVKRWASRLLPGTMVNMIVYRKIGGKYVPLEIRVPLELARD